MAQRPPHRQSREPISRPRKKTDRKLSPLAAAVLIGTAVAAIAAVEYHLVLRKTVTDESAEGTCGTMACGTDGCGVAALNEPRGELYDLVLQLAGLDAESDNALSDSQRAALLPLLEPLATATTLPNDAAATTAVAIKAELTEAQLASLGSAEAVGCGEEPAEMLTDAVVEAESLMQTEAVAEAVAAAEETLSQPPGNVAMSCDSGNEACSTGSS